MNYNRELLARRFQTAPSAYRPMMFWVWNGDLEPERIRRQVADMAQKGCGGFFIHPMGEQFRLRDFIRGQSPPYLSDAYFEAVRCAVEAAAEHRVFAWLYDEGGWPSGTAQGHVLAGHPEHAAHVVRMQALEVPPGEELSCPQGTQAALATFRDHWPETLEISDGVVTVPSLADGVLLFVTAPIEGRVNLLSRAAVRRFIDVTHARYAETVGDWFGTVIPGIFTDEPGVVGRVGSDEIPWTDNMLALFEQRRGFDLRPFLPALMAENLLREDILSHYSATTRMQVRCEFYDLWTDLYHEAYWEQINAWCEQHRLIHTGHVGGEDSLPDHARHGFGHFFKTAGALHAPGVDVIWRQLHWEQENTDFPQLAASAAHQRPGQGGAPDEDSPFDNLVVTETNGVYGLGLTYEQMRWLVDYQCLRGINMICPMSYSYDTSGGLLYRTMDHIGPGNPLWPHYGGFADYVGRLCAMLRSGVALADVAVYYPIEGAWADAGGEQAQEVWRSLQAITRALHQEQVAFDFLDAYRIRRASVSQGALETPGQFYGTVVVPATTVLPADVASQLLELYRSGGRVVFVGEPPSVSSTLVDGDKLTAVMGELALHSVAMDLERESHELGGDTRSGIDEAARWDGLASGFGIPRGRAHFAADVMQEQAVLTVPEAEIIRLARLLALRAGHYGLQLAEERPRLRLAVREMADVQVGFLMNEDAGDVEFELEVVKDRPSLLEQWDPSTGGIRLLAAHTEVSEITRVRLQLRAGESCLLVLSPIDELDEGAQVGEPERHNMHEQTVIDSLDQPTKVTVEAIYRIEGGDVEVLEPEVEAPQPPAQLGPWEDLGLDSFSGTVGYEFSFAVAADYLEQPVFLDLGEVCYSAWVYLNGEQLPPLLWRPHVIEVSRFLRGGDNHLRVVVTNTLANQACSEAVVEQAKQAGWLNTYYDRALPMMRQSLRSGLIGPVKLYVEG